MIQNQKSLCNRFEIASKSLFDARNYMYKVSDLQAEIQTYGINVEGIHTGETSDEEDGGAP